MNWLFLTLLLLFSDPAGDDHGAGIGYPRADLYRQVGIADLTGFEMQPVNGHWRLGFRLDRYPNPAGAPLGFSLAVVAVYLDTKPGGEELLTGTGLKTPAGGGWDEAYLVSGWGAEKRTPAGDAQAAPSWSADGWIWIDTALKERPRAYVVAGIYDPFKPWGFRPVIPGGGIWYLDGPADAPRALDVIADDQTLVWRSGVLQPAQKSLPLRSWLAGALALVGTGLVGLGWFKR